MNDQQPKSYPVRPWRRGPKPRNQNSSHLPVTSRRMEHSQDQNFLLRTTRRNHRPRTHQLSTVTNHDVRKQYAEQQQNLMFRRKLQTSSYPSGNYVKSPAKPHQVLQSQILQQAEHEQFWMKYPQYVHYEKNVESTLVSAK